MKRILTIFAATLVAMASCTQGLEQVISTTQESGVSGNVLAVANDFTDGGVTTRTVISQQGTQAPTFAWKEGDVIGVVPMDNKTVQSNYEIAKINSDSRQAVFDGGVWALKEGMEYAAYYPFKREMAVSGDNLTFSFLGQNQSENNSLAHLGDYDYMYARPTVCADNAATFQFEHLGSLVRLQLTVPSNIWTAVKLESSEPWFADHASLNLSDGSFVAVDNQKSCSVALDDILVYDGHTLTVWFAVLPTKSVKHKALTVTLSGYLYDAVGEIFIPDEWQAGKAYSYSANISHELLLPTSTTSNSDNLFGFALEFVTVSRNAWNDNHAAGKIKQHTEEGGLIEDEVHYIPDSWSDPENPELWTTYTVAGKTYSVEQAYEIATRGFLMLMGYDVANYTGGASATTLPELKPAATLWTKIPEPIEGKTWKWGGLPYNESGVTEPGNVVKANGGPLRMGDKNAGTVAGIANKCKLDILINYGRRHLAYIYNNAITIPNFCGYSGGQVDGYFGTFCAKRYYMALVSFYEYMLAGLTDASIIPSTQEFDCTLYGNANWD